MAKKKRELNEDNPFIRTGKKGHFGYGKNVNKKKLVTAKKYSSALWDTQKKHEIILYSNKELIEKLCVKNEGKDSILPSTYRLLFYILLNLEEQKDWIELGHLKVDEEIGISSSAYDNATKQLEKLGLII